MAALLAMSVIHVAAEVTLPKVLWWDMDVALATENLGCVAAALSKISYASYRREEALTRVLRPSRVPSSSSPSRYEEQALAFTFQGIVNDVESPPAVMFNAGFLDFDWK